MDWNSSQNKLEHKGKKLMKIGDVNSSVTKFGLSFVFPTLIGWEDERLERICGIGHVVLALEWICNFDKFWDLSVNTKYVNLT